jgi:putative ABC transport system permease protein
MNLTKLALRDISGNAFRSWMIAVCALLIGGFVVATALIAWGAGDSFRLTERRLGADIVVVPEGTAQTVEGALLMGSPVKVWLPAADVAKIAAVPGVAAASPQLYLTSMTNSSCCSVSDMFMVAYDPATDFTIQPWLKNQLGKQLGLSESVGGTFVFVPPGEQEITLYGYPVSLVANLEPTGSNLDASLFITFETAYEMAAVSRTKAKMALDVPKDFVSSVMVMVAAGYDSSQVALAIQNKVPGVTPVASPDLFGSFRNQARGERVLMLIILAIVLVLSPAALGFVFSMSVHQRRREIGVLRALGATSGRILRSLLAGAAVLALAGGAAGILLAGLIIYFFRNKLVASFGFPFLFPSLPSLVLLILIGLAAALLTVLVAAIIPAYRISRQEPAVSMRE